MGKRVFLAPEQPCRQSKRATMNRIVTLIIIITVLCSHLQNVYAGEIIINAVGDLMLAGTWAPGIRKSGYDTPFQGVAEELAKGNITIANLESPISKTGNEFTSKKFRFRAEPAVATAIKKSGINLVTLANNHSMDYGASALAETFLHLNRAGIAWIGAGENLDEARKMALYTIQDRKIAFLGYSLTQPSEFFAGNNRPGTTPGLETIFVEDIRRARQQADTVIVSFHWGTEGKNTVQPYQRIAARKAIDAGADVIIGHHPHVLRGVERYKKSLIFYSLGNFVFASKSKTADTSMIVRLRLGDTHREAELLPLDILHKRVGFQPHLLSGAKAQDVINYLNRLSKPFNTEIENHDNRYVLAF
jgi:poly-gamma-glutamate synthesis protein (capsule biosynthesis protein)